jgi:hypothetical protein
MTVDVEVPTGFSPRMNKREKEGEMSARWCGGETLWENYADNAVFPVPVSGPWGLEKSIASLVIGIP